MNISIFKNMTSKLPLPGLLEGVANLIRTDERIKAFTASYRQTGSKTFKSECPLFAVACTFEGGKGQENIKGLTGLSLVDFDHIVEPHTDSPSDDISHTDLTELTESATTANDCHKQSSIRVNPCGPCANKDTTPGYNSSRHTDLTDLTEFTESAATANDCHKQSSIRVNPCNPCANKDTTPGYNSSRHTDLTDLTEFTESAATANDCHKQSSIRVNPCDPCANKNTAPECISFQHTDLTELTDSIAPANGRYERNQAHENPCDPCDPCANKKFQELKAKIIADPHTLMCYTTISGNGLRVIYKYELAQNSNELYQQAFFAGNAYYERLLGIKADPQCKNITRLSGLAHDPEVFLRPESEAVAFTMEEITKESTTYAKQSKEDKQLRRIQTYYDTLIAPQLAKDNIQFAPGSHNDYVMRVGYKLAERRFSKKVATKWAKQQFAAYADTEQVFTSCFANATPKGNATGGSGKSDTKTATVDEIKSFLDTHIKLRYNEITTRIEYLEEDANKDVTSSLTTNNSSLITNNWLPINDRKVNSLWAEMSTITRVNKQDLYSIIESDYVPPFNPFKAYFEGLGRTRIYTNSTSPSCDISHTDLTDLTDSVAPSDECHKRSPIRVNPWIPCANINNPCDSCDPCADKNSPCANNESMDEGAIKALAKTVRVKGGEQEQLRWEYYLRKWLVAMVASWLSNDTVNNVILVLIGEQGAFKTTWFNYLLPPPLKQYFYTKTNANRMSKDDLLTLAQYALVCCEELDTMRPAELNQLKAVVTMPSIDERAAYAHYHEHRQHIASFCGTGNNPQFLSDPTGNRRWLPFEVESIRSPREHPFDYDAIYAEAYALYKSGFKYWFEKEEIQELNKHNREFETPHLERELVGLYFRKPGPAEAGEFMSVARALQIISAGISQKLSAVNVGRAFVELGFERVRTRSSRGFIVVSRTAEEMKAYQCAQLHDAQPE